MTISGFWSFGVSRSFDRARITQRATNAMEHCASELHVESRIYASLICAGTESHPRLNIRTARRSADCFVANSLSVPIRQLRWTRNLWDLPFRSPPETARSVFVHIHRRELRLLDVPLRVYCSRFVGLSVRSFCKGLSQEKRCRLEQ